MTKRILLIALAALALAVPSYAATIHTIDFIADGTRTSFNSFEAIPNDGTHYTGVFPYTEGGISVAQINGDPPGSIWVNVFSPDGIDGWYPDGGDAGYTRVTLAGGADFSDVGFFYATGFFAGSTTQYALYDNGGLVTAGAIPGTPHLASGFLYLGFGGGGFDEIRLWDGVGTNAFAIDAIETRAAAVPEPATLSLLGLGLIGAAARRRRGSTT